MENHGTVSETKCTFDVFPSFRGEDTRHTFTSKLHDALWLKGVDTFMDDKELKNGDKIGPTLHKAIEEARISVVVLSENYANSSWCLDELVKIHECMESKNQLVWPIFYKVNPSDVRHQKGSYGEAMTKHETSPGIDLEKVHKWRSTLNEIANLKGEHLEEGRDESKFIDDLAAEIFKKVSPKDLSREMFIVGREDRVKELKLRLDLESCDITCKLGIHGTGGIGKTTLAKALFDSIYKEFDGSSFLNVGETSNPKTDLKHLQEKLLSEILEDDKIRWRNIEEGNTNIERRLAFKRVLIVLDNVDDIEQLNNLAGNCARFGPGSRIIITTRDKHLLDLGEVEKRYEVKMLGEKESLELFCHYAFRKSCPESNYKDLSNRAMGCCKGLPLALKVLGSHLFKGNVDVWKDALDRYEKSPHGDVQKVLRISYDSLFRNDRDIFLDVACFFKGQRLDYVKTVLDACDFSTGDGIRTLVNKSLLTVDNDCLGMHDLIQDMGREIVKEKARNKIGERSRLWHHEDVLQVLADDNGSSEIQGIMLDPPHRKEINCIDTVFEKMKNLRILIVRNTSFSHEPRYLPNNLRLLDWKSYPSKSFPSEFNPRKIGAFNGSPQLLLEKPFQFDHLTYMNISGCDKVSEFPDVSGAMNLRKLILDGCENLVSIHKSVGHLANLVSLSASNCTQLQSFVPTIYLPSLESLSFTLCERLTHFPDIEGKMDKPLEIVMSHTTIQELPDSIKELNGLTYLEMTGCWELRDLPSSLFKLPNLVTLKLGECAFLPRSLRMFIGSSSTCTKIETLHFDNTGLRDFDLKTIVSIFPNLKDLNVSHNRFYDLVSSISKLTNLISLDVSYCTDLKGLPVILPSSVRKVDATECRSLDPNFAAHALWTQVKREKNGLEIKMPKWEMPDREIPNWFHYVKNERFPDFKVRGKFPAVAIAFVFGEVNAIDKANRSINVGMHLLIEGERRKFRNVSVPKNHVLLCDLRGLFSMEEGEDVGVGVGNDWKTVQVYCDTKLPLCSWGVYVYKETNMNIQFTSNDPSSSF